MNAPVTKQSLFFIFLFLLPGMAVYVQKDNFTAVKLNLGASGKFNMTGSVCTCTLTSLTILPTWWFL